MTRTTTHAPASGAGRVGRRRWSWTKAELAPFVLVGLLAIVPPAAGQESSPPKGPRVVLIGIDAFG